MFARLASTATRSPPAPTETRTRPIESETTREQGYAPRPKAEDEGLESANGHGVERGRGVGVGTIGETPEPAEEGQHAGFDPDHDLREEAHEAEDTVGHGDPRSRLR